MGRGEGRGRGVAAKDWIFNLINGSFFIIPFIHSCTEYI